MINNQEYHTDLERVQWSEAMNRRLNRMSSTSSDPVYTRAKDSGFITKPKCFSNRIHVCVCTFSDESDGKSSRF